MNILIAGKPELTGNYTAALESLGAHTQVWLPDINRSIPTPPGLYSDTVLSDVQGLLLPGGGDIHPAFYGQKNTACICLDPLLDLAQFSLLGYFLRAGKPVLGICKGMQLINVALGGTLIQDLPESLRSPHAYQDRDAIHTTDNLPETCFFRLYGNHMITNSAHHQAIDSLAPDLIPAAYGPGNVLEAFFHRTLPVLGVQWHPERMYSSHKNAAVDDGLLLLRYFLSLCPQ